MLGFRPIQKYLLFANLKKCCFYQNKFCFLGYIVLSKSINMETKKIKIVWKWPEPKSVQDIQVFLDFANFYWWFIQDFNKIAASFTSILKTTLSVQMLVASEVLAIGEIGGVIGGNELIEKGRKLLKTRKLSKGLKLSKSRNSKDKKLDKSKKLLKSSNSPNFNTKKAGPSFLTSKARGVFNYLQLVFTKALILWHFDPECHIWIKT